MATDSAGTCDGVPSSRRAGERSSRACQLTRTALGRAGERGSELPARTAFGQDGDTRLQSLATASGHVATTGRRAHQHDGVAAGLVNASDDGGEDAREEAGACNGAARRDGRATRPTRRRRAHKMTGRTSHRGINSFLVPWTTGQRRFSCKKRFRVFFSSLSSLNMVPHQIFFSYVML